MNHTLPKKEAIHQVPRLVELEKVVASFENLGDLLDHVEPRGSSFCESDPVAQYAADGFMRFIGAMPYERSHHSRDYLHGS
jgi:hypothetical protein